ncbi:hypothetical protein [Metabacillus sp. 84]|uniref:hypothetical protein n=1 Tax=unclassified Metabacillus TaxID=2675274 RepID=UPI003CEDECE7
MVNLISQQATVLVRDHSRFNGGNHDMVTVFTTIMTDGPLVDDYYVPNGNSLSDVHMALIKSEGLEFRPYLASELMTGTDNVVEAATSGNTLETSQDIARLLLRSALIKTPLQLLAKVGSQHVYEIHYDYKIYNVHPADQNTFEFQIRLPFDGTVMGNGSKVDLAVLTPTGASIDQVNTHGTDEANQEITEVIQQLQQQNRAITTFHYQIDPLFTVRYTHTTPVMA